MKQYQVLRINMEHEGDDDPRLLVVCDAPSQIGFQRGSCITDKQRGLLTEMLGSAALGGIVYVSPCSPIPEAISENERKVAEFLAEHAAEFRKAISSWRPSIVVTLGKHALRQVAGRPIKITEARGTFHTFESTGQTPVMPVMSMSNLLIRPQIRPVMESDLRQVADAAENGWVPVERMAAADLQYEWCLDLEHLVRNPPTSGLVLDTETKGYIWFGRQAILTVQLCVQPGKAIAVPLDKDYWNNDALRGETSKHLPKLTDAKIAKLLEQLRQILGNPDVPVCGHNLKFDLHHLHQYGITVADWHHDTLQLAFTVDENMRQKNLDECTRRWVPALAGYADAFNHDPVHQGKERMDLVPHDQMLLYGCGDVDATRRLVKVLLAEAKKDERNYRVYETVKMPALRHVFFEHAERYGLPVDEQELAKLSTDLSARAEALHKELVIEVAQKWPEVAERHAAAGLKLSRPNFVRDILFSPQGLNIEAIMATKKTAKLSPEEQLESISKKDHLPYFSHIPWVAKYIGYQDIATLVRNFAGRESTAEWELVPRLRSGAYPRKITEAFTAAGKEHLLLSPVTPRRRSTAQTDEERQPQEAVRRNDEVYGMLGRDLYRLIEEPAKGFWWYLENVDHRALHPSFGLDVAVTGRSNCRDPNLQNVPKRGPEAKAFRRIFKAPPGWTLIECDLSQAELRVAACMANERNMISIYADGGDIHAMTGQRVAGLTDAQWEKTSKEKKKELRQMAKAVNFGYLYGMWWRKFVMYARTSYGVTVTDKEAERSRETYFRLYPGLVKYHEAMRSFVRKNKYVRALHGALRRLPDIDSVEEGMQKECERQAINSPVQGFASDLGLMGATLFAKGCDPSNMRVLGFIHDATVVMVREAQVENACKWLRWCMQNQPLEEYFGLRLPVPVVADISVGRTLADMEERPDVEASPPPWICTPCK
jgi:uracil-DNA glycosylase family 4